MDKTKRCYWDGMPCECKGACQKDPFVEPEDDPHEDGDVSAYRKEVGTNWWVQGEYYE